ncbi:hypothetical protein [Streptomyces achromogenes]|uniref:hypothetical protein n=1 Tax=Streptomyces achromogenes TaxID=67255 RepID=UPI00368D0AC0
MTGTARTARTAGSAEATGATEAEGAFAGAATKPVGDKPAGGKVTAFNDSLGRLRRSMRRSAWNKGPLSPARDMAWRTSLVRRDPDPAVTRLTAADFGYQRAGRGPATRSAPAPEQTAYSGPHRLLTDEGVARLRRVCENLADRAPDDDYIVSRRVRNVFGASRFVRAMVSDPAFLGRVSAIAGQPLIPHPLTTPAICANYFDTQEVCVGDRKEPQTARWHYDGMTYVFVMQLADRTEFANGRLMLYRGTRADFDRDREAVAEQGSSHPKVFEPPLERAGDTVYTLGSSLWHAVQPVTSGARLSVILSFFAPMERHDSNPFWHLAAEDGIVEALSGFAKLRKAQSDPLGYCARTGIDLTRVITEAERAAPLVAPH